MDHHCPFIGNCVGAGNHRHFLLFLVWAQLSGVYMLGMGLWAGGLMWPTLIQLRNEHLHQAVSNSFNTGSSLFFEILQLILTAQIDLTVRAIGVGYIIIAAIAVLFGLGILFCQQMRLVSLGQTYIDHIQLGTTASGAPILKATLERSGMEAWMDNLRRIFGKGPVLFWLLPRLAPPPGTLAHKLHDKFP
eukprot:TRINITY_DN15119_c0_g1_i1.p1 TRINITY_DN15119_c0_g1~~TRINITY_DN15119_c0_g1_i1.p1  ORF type:complete len:205 (+),score=14.82 TRINITY_DN15119_c0_g1_i1:46-615(+)